MHLALGLGVSAATFAAIMAGIPGMNELDELPIAVPYLAWLIVAIAAPLVVTWAAAAPSARELAFARFIAELIVKEGFRLKMLKEEEIDLEDVFMGITKGITN